MRPSRVPVPAIAAAAVLLAFPVAGWAADRAAAADVQRGLDGLVAASGGPPGAVATLYRNDRLTVLSVGRADIRRKGVPRARQHMRIASVAKAFSGAVALRLVGDARLRLDDTIEQRVAGMASASGGDTVLQTP